MFSNPGKDPWQKPEKKLTLEKQTPKRRKAKQARRISKFGKSQKQPSQVESLTFLSREENTPNLASFMCEQTRVCDFGSKSQLAFFQTRKSILSHPGIGTNNEQFFFLTHCLCVSNSIGSTFWEGRARFPAALSTSNADFIDSDRQRKKRKRGIVDKRKSTKQNKKRPTKGRKKIKQPTYTE